MQDYFGFQGKTVLVTGASSGMGEAAAKMLVDLGAEVHAVGNRKKITYNPAREYYVNLGEKEQLDGLIAQLPEKLDAIFICQGMAQGAGKELLVQKVNFLSVKYLAEQLAPGWWIGARSQSFPPVAGSAGSRTLQPAKK